MKREKKEVRNGKVRRVFRDYGYTECERFAEYLHEMSLKGWHFIKWKMGLVFEKGDPEDITYCVEVFPKGSEMDLKPGDEAEEYAEYCKEAGWELIDGKRRFCIFRRIKPDVPPIVTQEERLENIRKAENREFIWGVPIFVFLVIQYWFDILVPFGTNFVNLIFNPPRLWILLCVTLMLAVKILRYVQVQIWVSRGRRLLQEGKLISYDRQPIRKMWEWIIWILMMAGAVGLLLWGNMSEAVLISTPIALIILVMYAVIYWVRPSRETNWWVQTGFGFGIILIMIIAVFAVIFKEREPAENREVLEQLPLTQEDYREIDGELDFAECVVQGSIFGNYLYGKATWIDENEKSDTLTYQIYRSEFPWVLNKIWKTQANSGYYINTKETDPKPWGALEVRKYTNWGNLIVCARYEDALLFFFTDTPPEEDITELIIEKLDLDSYRGSFAG